METAIALTRKAAAVFEERGIEEARLTAELLLAAVLGVRRLDLYLQHDRPIEPEELALFRSYVKRRLRHEPVQYILGVAAFRELELKVDRRVLIPRPETEVLVGEVISWSERGTPGAVTTAVDIGTGSGAIALSLARETAIPRIIATDASADALATAMENARRLGLDGRVDFRCGDLFSVLGDVVADVIVSNPPYVADHERARLDPEVRDWEPERALFSGASGLELIERIVSGAALSLRQGGLLALEVGQTQAEPVSQLLSGGGFRATRVVRDLSGRERIVAGERS